MLLMLGMLAPDINKELVDDLKGAFSVSYQFTQALLLALFALCSQMPAFQLFDSPL